MVETYNMYIAPTCHALVQGDEMIQTCHKPLNNNMLACIALGGMYKSYMTCICADTVYMWGYK